MKDDTELIPRITIAQMIDAYNNALKSIDQAYEILGQAQSKLTAAYGQYGPDVWYCSSASYQHRRHRDDIKRDMLKSCWKKIIERLDLDKLCTEKKAKEIRDRIENNPPALTVEEVAATLKAWMENRQSLTQEYLADVYKSLKPENHHWSHHKYVTNNTPGIGKKVILTWYVENRYGGGFRVIYNREDALNRIERAMYYLDGAHYPHEAYKSYLVDAIDTSPDGTGETDYFRFKSCQNGNLHLEFKRPDLTAKLDRMFGGLAVKQGRKVYNQTEFV